MPAKNALCSWRTALAISIHGALSACGPQFRQVALLDVPELASADYVAIAEPREPSDDEIHAGRIPPNSIVHEQGEFACLSSLESSETSASCPSDLRSALLEARQRSIIVADHEGHPSIFAAPPPTIDTAERALARVWLEGYETSIWIHGDFSGARRGYVRPTGEGFEVLVHENETDSTGGCGDGPRRITRRYFHRVVLVRRDGTFEPRGRSLAHEDSYDDDCHPRGRRPQDFADIASGQSVRGHLLRAMHHEAESVRAFLRFARELNAYGAPRALVEAAEHAADDERRHAWAMGRLVGSTPQIDTDDLPIRSLADCARENAIEGCVHETFAAAFAAHQADHARTDALRACFAEITEDEIGHAALAHTAREFFDARLSSETRRSHRRAAGEAARKLEQTFRDPTSETERFLGYPTRTSARRLLHAVTRASE